MSEKIIRLFGNNDPRITELVNDIISLIYDRATGQMTVASIIEDSE